MKVILAKRDDRMTDITVVRQDRRNPGLAQAENVPRAEVKAEIAFLISSLLPQLPLKP